MLSISSSLTTTDASKKRRLQVMVFPEVVQFDCEKDGYRTTRVNSFFGIAVEILQEVGQKEKSKSSFVTNFSLSVDRRIELSNSYLYKDLLEYNSYLKSLLPEGNWNRTTYTG